MSQGVWVLLVVVVLAMAFGIWRAGTDGRFSGTHAVRGLDPATAEHSPAPGSAVAVPSALDGLDLDQQRGERATLLQFSSAFCAPCRATRRVLEEVAGLVPGVTHVEVDAESHLDLVRALDVLRTPTTLILDREGREVSRASGALRQDQVLSALAAAMPEA